MPLQIQRTATVYRLWDDQDLAELFDSHAAAGWLCSVSCGLEDQVVVWRVGLQHTANRVHVTALREGVVVSDGTTLVAQTVAEYNTANPDNMIEVGS